MLNFIKKHLKSNEIPFTIDKNTGCKTYYIEVICKVKNEVNISKESEHLVISKLNIPWICLLLLINIVNQFIQLSNNINNMCKFVAFINFNLLSIVLGIGTFKNSIKIKH